MNTSTAASTSTAAPAAAPSSADKRKATVDKNRQQRIAERGYSLPLVLTCTVTGKSVKYTSPAYIDKVIDKSPGKTLDSLHKTYVSREGRRQVAAQTPKVAKAPKAEKAPKAPKAEKAPKAPKAPKAAAPAASAPAAQS